MMRLEFSPYSYTGRSETYDRLLQDLQVFRMWVLASTDEFFHKEAKTF